MKNFFVCSILVLTLFVSCKNNRVILSVERENQFSLNYGTFEDELNLFNVSSVGYINTKLAMKDGFFYISNSESKKIMELNSYGDLLTLYYNEDENIKPSFAGDKNSASATRKAISYPFNEITSIAIDSNKCIYAVEKLPVERQEFDESKKIFYSQVVLRFSEKGDFIDYIGQEGPGGMPFPYIKEIFTVEDEELVVVCSEGEQSVVFWFSSDGFLLYKIPISKDNIPNPLSSDKNDSYFAVESIIPDYKSRKLYIKVDYYSAYIDESSYVQSGIDYKSTIVYPFNIEEELYEKSIEIPSYVEEVTSGFSVEKYEIPYDFIGVTESGWLFFMLASDDGLDIQIVQDDGQKIMKRRLPLNRNECLYYTFSLDNTGIISVLIVYKDKAVVDWWRTDTLIQALIK